MTALLNTRLVRDWLTGLDGETWALGRALGVLIVLVCLILAIGVTISVAVTKPHASASEWGAFLTGLGAFIVAVAGAAWTMIRGTNAVEPSGSVSTTLTTTPTSATLETVGG